MSNEGFERNEAIRDHADRSPESFWSGAEPGGQREVFQAYRAEVNRNRPAKQAELDVTTASPHGRKARGNRGGGAGAFDDNVETFPPRLIRRALGNFYPQPEVFRYGEPPPISFSAEHRDLPAVRSGYLSCEEADCPRPGHEDAVSCADDGGIAERPDHTRKRLQKRCLRQAD